MLVSFRALAACIVLSLISGIELQAQKAICSFNTWVLNPNNPSNPAAFTGGVNDNSTVVGAATYYLINLIHRDLYIILAARSLTGVRPTRNIAASDAVTIWGTRLAFMWTLWELSMLSICTVPPPL